MVALCFYFQVHQPYRLRQVRLDENAPAESLFSDEKNRSVFHKVAEKCYWPMGKLLEHLLLKYPNDFRVSFSFSGTFLSQCKEYDPNLYALYSFLGRLPNAHIICETSHHSLAALRSPSEFRSQVAEQLVTLKELFNKVPRVFRNTELIYSDSIGTMVSQLGFEGCLLEGWDPWLPQGGMHTTFSSTQHRAVSDFYPRATNFPTTWLSASRIATGQVGRSQQIAMSIGLSRCSTASMNSSDFSWTMKPLVNTNGLIRESSTSSKILFTGSFLIRIFILLVSKKPSILSHAAQCLFQFQRAGLTPNAISPHGSATPCKRKLSIELWRLNPW